MSRRMNGVANQVLYCLGVILSTFTRMGSNSESGMASADIGNSLCYYFYSGCNVCGILSLFTPMLSIAIF